jgi:hypothetical protein
MFDGTDLTETIVSVIWYQYQLVLNRDRNLYTPGWSGGLSDSISPIDSPYTFGYFNGFASNDIPGGVVLAAQWVMQGFQRYINRRPDDPATGSLQWYWNAIFPQTLTHNNMLVGYTDFPVEDRATYRTQLADAAYTKFKDVACGYEQNGAASLFTPAMWEANQFTSSLQMPTSVNVGEIPGGTPGMFWHSIVLGKIFGVNGTTLDDLKSCAESIFTGPNQTLASGIDASQTTITLSASPGSNWNTSNFRFRVDSEDIDCTTRSSATLSGCTRGANGTTAASHSAGATAQIQIRWGTARNNACTFAANGLTITPGCVSALYP